MQKTNSLQLQRLELVFYSILFLFAFQLLSSFIEGVYAFGLLQTDIPAEIACVALLFSPLLLLVFRRGISCLGLAGLALLVVTCRVVAAALDTRGMMLAAGLGTGAFLLFLAALYAKSGQSARAPSGALLGISLALAVGASVFLRALGSGSDFSMLMSGRWIGWLLAAGGLVMLREWLREGQVPEGSAPFQYVPPTHAPVRFWRLTGMALGMVSALLLLYSVFTSPGVIVRWTGQSYQVVLLVMMCLLWGAGMLADQRLVRLKAWLLPWNGLFVAALTGLIALNQTVFPVDPGGFPLLQAEAGSAAWVALVLTVVSFPVIFLDVFFLGEALRESAASPARLGGAFGLGGLFLLLGVFAQVFTTVYDYIPLVGPFFRDKYWLVFLVPGGMLTLSLWLVGRPSVSARIPFTSKERLAVLGILLLLVLGTWNRVAQNYVLPEPAPDRSLQVMTYNIQQGYTAAGQRDYDAQLAVVRGVGPDLLGLQETDTARIANGNNDVVRYFADRLGMHVYYGPKTTTGTFGIALLSRFPIRNPQTFFMSSQGEQTAAIQAQIRVDGVTFNVFVTHLGNGGPLIQQEQLLSRVSGLQNVILMGDFNFRPDTPQYELTAGMLESAWLLGGQGVSGQADFNPQKRIDHIFVSPGMRVRSAEYLLSPASDHPALTAGIEW